MHDSNGSISRNFSGMANISVPFGCLGVCGLMQLKWVICAVNGDIPPRIFIWLDCAEKCNPVL